MGALEGSSGTNPRKIRPPVSSNLPTSFHVCHIPFRNLHRPLEMTSKLSSLLIQISSLRRNNNVFTSVIYDLLELMSHYSNNQLLLLLCTSTMTQLTRPGRVSPTHQTWKPFYITSCCQKNLALRRTTPPSCIKWWSCVFREWIGLLATKWSAMLVFTLFSFKILYSSVWQTARRSMCFRQLGQSFTVFALKKILLLLESSLFINWHIYRRLQ